MTILYYGCMLATQNSFKTGTFDNLIIFIQWPFQSWSLHLKSFTFHKKPMISCLIWNFVLGFGNQLKNNRKRIVQQTTYIKNCSQVSERENFQRNTTVKCKFQLTLPDMCMVQDENEKHKDRRSGSQREKETGKEEYCLSNYGSLQSWWIFDDLITSSETLAMSSNLL